MLNLKEFSLSKKSNKASKVVTVSLFLLDVTEKYLQFSSSEIIAKYFIEVSK